MNATPGNIPQIKTNNRVCQDQLWFLSLLFPLERELLSADCLPGAKPGILVIVTADGALAATQIWRDIRRTEDTSTRLW
jgi:hypothetical protein